MLKKICASVLLVATFNSHLAFAALSPVAVSIVPPLQFPSEEFSVTGARLSVIYGKHRDLYGIDLGVIGNITEQDFVGIGVSGVANWTKGTTTIIGLQAAGLANVNMGKTNVFGLQAAVGANYNEAAASVTGLQVALANLSDHTVVYGAQLGIYNKAQDVYGFQIGIINVADTLHGLQIGLLNFHRKGTFVVSPIINFGF